MSATLGAGLAIVGMVLSVACMLAGLLELLPVWASVPAGLVLVVSYYTLWPGGAR